MIKGTHRALLGALLGIAGLLAAGSADPVKETTGWRLLLSFDMTKEATRRADIGNHTMLIAEGDSNRWDLEVRQYPFSKNTENLLYDGHNWHGLQDWMLLPKYVTNNPHISVVTYDKGKCQMKIVARGCQRTADGSNDFAFSSGVLEIFHKP